MPQHVKNSLIECRARRGKYSVFTSALARVFDSAGEPPPTVQLIIGVLVVAIACVLAVIYWRSQSHASSIAVDFEQPNLNEANASRAFGSEPGHSNSTSEADVADMEVSSEIESLMSAVREQAVELRCEHTKALSNSITEFRAAIKPSCNDRALARQDDQIGKRKQNSCRSSHGFDRGLQEKTS